MDSRQYIARLCAGGKKLVAIRDEELRRADHPSAAIYALSGSFLAAVASSVPAPSSGLVEYQRILSRMKR